MLWQLAMCPPRWFTTKQQCWGIDPERQQLVSLIDLDQVLWRVDQPVLATPLFILMPLIAQHTGQKRWWFCWHSWLSQMDYRRLLRACWRWRQH
jgi:hypothetical protein